MDSTRPILFLASVFALVFAGRYDIPYPDGLMIIKEGDILTWNTTGLMSSALRDSSRKWANAKVPIYFHEDLTNSDKSVVIEAIKEIHDKTCVRFMNAKDHHIDFLLIMKQWRGCNSFVGRIGGKQVLNLEQNCYTRGVVLHELMHALGFIHEHNRADRDQFVTINWHNIEREKEDQFAKRKAADLTLMDTGYSYDSIMHYESTAFSKDDSSPTIVPKKQGAKLGGGDSLSEIDATRINRYYGCGSTTTEAPKQEIEWTRYDFDMYWSLGCDFPGHDIETVASSMVNCLHKCFYNPRCTHITWTPNGACNLKAIATANATTKCGPKEYLCGIKGSPEAEKTTYSTCTTSQAATQEMEWNFYDFDMHWSHGCDFPGHDIETVTSSSSDCLDKCYYNPKCTHFTWTPNGACNLKTIATANATPRCGPRNYVCGIKGSAEAEEPVYSGCTASSGTDKQKISWTRYDYDMHWSSGCDFPGQDIATFKSSSKQCVDKCAYNPRCTHITWTPNGYCNLKTIATANAVPKCGPKKYICGVKETAKLQSVMCP